MNPFPVPAICTARDVGLLACDGYDFGIEPMKQEVQFATSMFTAVSLDHDPGFHQCRSGDQPPVIRLERPSRLRLSPARF